MAIPRARFIIGGFLIAGAFAYLAFAGLGSDWIYFQDVDSFVKGHPASGSRVRLHGLVEPEGLEVQPLDLKARFHLGGSTERLPVEYRGQMPGLFAPGTQVVVEGQLDAGGTFQADVLLTKCASKYEAATNPHAEAPAAP